MSTNSRLGIVASLLLGSIAFDEPRAKLHAEATRDVAGRKLSVAAGPRCPDPADLYAQCPNLGANGAESRLFGFSDTAGDISLAESFSLPDGGTVHRVRWWGMYLLTGSEAGCGPAPTDDFSLFIWSDTGSAPAEGQPIPLSPHSVVRVAEPVGEVLVGLDPAPVFEFELTFSSGGFIAEPGSIYWIEIRGSNALCNWAWMTAPGPPGDGGSRQRTPSIDATWSNPTSRGFDLAVSFQLDDSIPTISVFGMILLAAVSLSGGAIVIRSRRRCVIPSGTPGAGRFVPLCLLFVGVLCVESSGYVVPRTVPPKPASVTEPVYESLLYVEFRDNL